MVPAALFCRAFLSTLSLRRATENSGVTLHDLIISIHALLAESDMRSYTRPYRSVLFLSTLSLRRATCKEYICSKLLQFLSTLSLRRATRSAHCRRPAHCHFYPRSPCGERRASQSCTKKLLTFLSTLSLRRATETRASPETSASPFLSTLSLRRATYTKNTSQRRTQFLSTLSLRRATAATAAYSKTQRFLSTLSLRRAT